MMGAFSSIKLEKNVLTNTVEVTGMSGATVVVAGAILAGAVVVGVTTVVTVLLTGATGFDVGDGSDQDRWGANIAPAFGTESDNTDWTIGTIEAFPSGSDITLTALGGNFTAGSVRVTTHYLIA